MTAYPFLPSNISAIFSFGKGLINLTFTSPTLIPFSLAKSTATLVVPTFAPIVRTTISASSHL